jgi:hypothetical protein
LISMFPIFCPFSLSFKNRLYVSISGNSGIIFISLNVL